MISQHTCQCNMPQPIPVKYLKVLQRYPDGYMGIGKACGACSRHVCWLSLAVLVMMPIHCPCNSCLASDKAQGKAFLRSKGCALKQQPVSFSLGPDFPKQYWSDDAMCPRYDPAPSGVAYPTMKQNNKPTSSQRNNTNLIEVNQRCPACRHQPHLSSAARNRDVHALSWR